MKERNICRHVCYQICVLYGLIYIAKLDIHLHLSLWLLVLLTFAPLFNKVQNMYSQRLQYMLYSSIGRQCYYNYYYNKCCCFWICVGQSNVSIPTLHVTFCTFVSVFIQNLFSLNEDKCYAMSEVNQNITNLHCIYSNHDFSCSFILLLNISNIWRKQ